jgi:hypothetical protein
MFNLREWYAVHVIRGFTLGIGVLLVLSGSHMVALAQAELDEIKGAPLDAPVEESPKSQDNTPDVKPLGRALPQESLDLLEQMEKNTGKDPLKFEKTRDGKYLKVTFNALGSFKYDVPDPDALLASPDPTKPLKDQIPSPIKKLDTKEVVIVGFMVPVEVDNKGNVKSFALTQNQMFCCFGVPPGMNEWVMVSMGDTPAKYYSDLPIAAFGKLEVGEEIEDGYVMSVYRMNAEKVMDVRELLRQAQAG